MHERASAGIPREKLADAKAVWGRILSMAKYLPVAVGVGALGKLATSGTLGVEMCASGFCTGTIYGLVSGENYKKGLHLGTMAALGIGSSLTLAANIMYGPTASTGIAMAESLFTLILAERYLISKSQESRQG